MKLFSILSWIAFKIQWDTYDFCLATILISRRLSIKLLPNWVTLTISSVMNARPILEGLKFGHPFFLCWQIVKLDFFAKLPLFFGSEKFSAIFQVFQFLYHTLQCFEWRTSSTEKHKISSFLYLFKFWQTILSSLEAQSL